VLFYGVVSDSTEEAVELFTSGEEAEAVVQAWDRDEPGQAGALRVERVEFETGTANEPEAAKNRTAESVTRNELGNCERSDGAGLVPLSPGDEGAHVSRNA
jgi:hypothetical protein